MLLSRRSISLVDTNDLFHLIRTNYVNWFRQLNWVFLWWFRCSLTLRTCDKIHRHETDTIWIFTPCVTSIEILTEKIYYVLDAIVFECNKPPTVTVLFSSTKFKSHMKLNRMKHYDVFAPKIPRLHTPHTVRTLQRLKYDWSGHRMRHIVHHLSAFGRTSPKAATSNAMESCARMCMPHVVGMYEQTCAFTLCVVYDVFLSFFLFIRAYLTGDD